MERHSHCKWEQQEIPKLICVTPYLETVQGNCRCSRALKMELWEITLIPSRLELFSSLVHSPSDLLHLLPCFHLTFCCCFYSQIPPFWIPYCPFKRSFEYLSPSVSVTSCHIEKSERGCLSNLKETQNLSEIALRGLIQLKHIINPK